MATEVTNGGAVWVEVFNPDPTVTEDARLVYASPYEGYSFSWTETSDLQLESGEVILLPVR